MFNNMKPIFNNNGMVIGNTNGSVVFDNNNMVVGNQVGNTLYNNNYQNIGSIKNDRIGAGIFDTNGFRSMRDDITDNYASNKFRTDLYSTKNDYILPKPISLFPENKVDDFILPKLETKSYDYNPIKLGYLNPKPKKNDYNLWGTDLLKKDF